MKCIIIGAVPLDMENIKLEDQDLVIASDGGYINCQKLNITPHLLVGDFDSLDTLPTDVDMIKYPTEKADTDTLLCLKEGMKRGYSDFILYGCVGERIEHTIANIQLLAWGIKRSINVELITNNIYMKLLKAGDTVDLKASFKGYISLFSYSKNSTITIMGLKYPVKRKHFTNYYPLGIDNEVTDTDAFIKIHQGQVLLIINKKM